MAHALSVLGSSAGATRPASGGSAKGTSAPDHLLLKKQRDVIMGMKVP